jgi:putative RecB family exonuclease
VPKPSHSSASQLSSWLHCQKSYQLKRIFDAPSIPSVWLVAGVALHDTFHSINLNHATGEAQPDVRTLFAANIDALAEKTLVDTGVPADQWRCAGKATKEKPDRENLAWWRIEGGSQAVMYLNWLRQSGWNLHTEGTTVLAEFETTAEFGGIMVKGFLDAVFTDDRGVLRLVDYKSGTRVPSSKTQLGLYAAALNRTLDMDIRYGSYFMTRKGEMTDAYDVSRYDTEYFDRIFGKLKIAMDNDIFIPNPGEACFLCDVRDYCYAAGGATAYQWDPDHPQYTPITQKG